MSKLACKCGHIISDTIYPSPTEATLLPQQDDDRIQSESSQAVNGFLSAVAVGHREEWLRQFFNNGCPSDISDASVISDILSVFERMISRSVAEWVVPPDIGMD
jgi:hypothetical protein